MERVANRVQQGGHNIPVDVIERQYQAGLHNLFSLFMKEMDIWILFDNSQNLAERVAFGGKRFQTKINDKFKFEIIKSYD